MATVTLRRSDVFPIGTTVSIYPAQSWRPGQSPQGPPTAPAIASAAVDAAGLLTVTNAGIASLTSYVAAAQVGGVWYGLRCRSTLDVQPSTRATGTGDTTTGSTALANVAATTGSFAIGQRVTGPGIPAGTYLLSGSGASWTMSDKATATALGVALEGHGAVPAAVPANLGAGAEAVPQVPSSWRARVMQRRAIRGTS